MLGAATVQMLLDPGNKARISRQTNEVEHPMLFTPAHQLFAAESAVAQNDDLNMLPPIADQAHDPIQFLRYPFDGIHIGGAKLRAQQVIAAADIQRQVAVAIVVAVEEPSLLFAMQFVVSSRPDPARSFSADRHDCSPCSCISADV